MNTLIFLLVTLQALSLTLNAPLKDSDVVAELEPPDDGVHNHTDPVREGKWTFNYAPGHITVDKVTGDEFSIGHKADIEIKESVDPADIEIKESVDPGVSGCPADETITSECLCGSNSCAKGSVCTSGKTCTPPGDGDPEFCRAVDCSLTDSEVFCPIKCEQPVFCKVVDCSLTGSQDFCPFKCAPAVDGGWSNWGEYGQCSEECGGGTQTRSRTCTNPSPQHGGLTCEQQNIGDDTESKDCNLNKCGCPADETITSECLCGSNSCAKGSVCVSGSTCTPGCPVYETMTSECMCGSNSCARGSVCISGSTCTEAIDSGCETAETDTFGSKDGEPFYIKPFNFEDIKYISIWARNIIEKFGNEFFNVSRSFNPYRHDLRVPEEIYQFDKEKPDKIKVEWVPINKYFGSVVTSITFINSINGNEAKFGGNKTFSNVRSQTIPISCKLGFRGYDQGLGISLAIITGCHEFWEFDVSYPGHDIRRCQDNEKLSAKECQQDCQINSECIGWEWGLDGNNCCIKRDLQNPTYAKGRVSGKKRSCETIRVCSKDEITSDACVCKAGSGKKEQNCMANQRCADGTCVNGCLIEDGVIFQENYIVRGNYVFPPTHSDCKGFKFLPEVRKIATLLKTENEKLKKKREVNDMLSGYEDTLLKSVTKASSYLNNCRVDRDCTYKEIVGYRENIESTIDWINNAKQVSSKFLESLDPANEKLQQKASKLFSMPACLGYSSKSYGSKDCICVENRICDVEREGCGRGHCFPICKSDNSMLLEAKCFCKNTKTEELQHCEAGTRCLLDGHCHNGYKVFGVSTSPVTASIDSILWTNQEYKITKIPLRLDNSILFRPEDLVVRKTIQLFSPIDATVFLALNENQNGGLMEELSLQGWGLKELDDGKWVVETDNPDKKLQKMWYRTIHENENITITTSEDGANFVIFFSTDCDWDEVLRTNCFCKNAGKHCRLGQVCRKEGICNSFAEAPIF